MARIRSVKPEFRTSQVVTRWPRDVRLFYALLWGYLDDSGRGMDDPRFIKADCFPVDDDITAATIDEWLDLIAETGTVVRYTVAGSRYLCIPDWDEHQKPQHPRPSKIPAMEYGDAEGGPLGTEEDLHESLMSDSRGVHDYLTPEGKGEEGIGEGEGEKNPSSSAVADATADPDSNRPAKVDAKNDRPEIIGLCVLLADLMVGNGCPRPPISKKWLDDARLMIDKDGRDPVKAAHLIEWCQRDPFWRSNIQSMPTFRSQYDKLRLRALNEWERGRREADGKRHQSDGFRTGVSHAKRLAEAEQVEERQRQLELLQGGVS